ARRWIARDRERLDHAGADRVGRLRARRLVTVEIDDALALVAEPEAREELGVVVAHPRDVERDDAARHLRPGLVADGKEDRERGRLDLAGVTARAGGAGRDPLAPLHGLLVRPERRDPAVCELSDRLDRFLLQRGDVDRDA